MTFVPFQGECPVCHRSDVGVDLAQTIYNNTIRDLQACIAALEESLQDCLDTYSRTAKRIPPTTQEAEKMMDDIHRANKRARDLLAKIAQERK